MCILGASSARRSSQRMTRRKSLRRAQQKRCCDLCVTSTVLYVLIAASACPDWFRYMIVRSNFLIHAIVLQSRVSSGSCYKAKWNDTGSGNCDRADYPAECWLHIEHCREKRNVLCLQVCVHMHAESFHFKRMCLGKPSIQSSFTWSLQTQHTDETTSKGLLLC